MTIDLKHLYLSIRQQIPDGVQLLAVSKTQSIESIQTLFELGQQAFAENQVQEALPKIAALTLYSYPSGFRVGVKPRATGLYDSVHEDCEMGEDNTPDNLRGTSILPIVWHFIGSIQTNKTKAIATHFDWVQTVCRDKEAVRLNNDRPTTKKPLQVCLQVNIGQEPQKNGLNPEDILPLAHLITSQLKNLNLRGLFCVPPNNRDSRPYFQQMAILYQQLKAQYPQCDTLSMGMSYDMITAIQMGSTCVRIGQALFGPRGDLNV